MNHKFPHKTLIGAVYKTALTLVFLIAIFLIFLHHISEFMKDNDNKESLSANTLVALMGVAGLFFISQVVLIGLAIKDLLKVWQVYSFDDTCMKIAVLSINLKTILYKDVTKIEIKNSSSNESCKTYYQTKHITIDRDALHYLDMKLLLLSQCEKQSL